MPSIVFFPSLAHPTCVSADIHSLRTLWRLFRKSTSSLTRDVLQPVLDNIETPPFIRSIRIESITLGKSPPILQDIQRIPSRALSELQFRFRARVVGDKRGVVNLRVAIRLPAWPVDVVVPVRVSNIDMDACVWLGGTVVPYAPWVRFAQWALFEMPSVRFRVRVGSWIPVTAIPVLRGVLVKLLTEELPKRFLFPLTQKIGGPMNGELAPMHGLSDAARSMSDAELRARFPQLAALFDSLDADDSGSLAKGELLDGLVEWGFASNADREAVAKVLDVNNDGVVQLREFLSVWPDLAGVFVPRKFRGVLSGVLVEAQGLRTPFIGYSDPYVLLSVEGESTASKRNLATSQKSDKGNAIWNEVCYLQRALVTFPLRLSHYGVLHTIDADMATDSMRKRAETLAGVGVVRPKSRKGGAPR